MGNDALVLWLSPELALAYFVAVVLGMVGVLQMVAAHWQRDEWRWLPRALAQPVGGALALGVLGWFYASYYRLIFVPGPAGLELMLLFGVGTVLAAWLCRALARLVQR